VGFRGFIGGWNQIGGRRFHNRTLSGFGNNLDFKQRAKKSLVVSRIVGGWNQIGGCGGVFWTSGTNLYFK
jgi:hypothetical protein